MAGPITSRETKCVKQRELNGDMKRKISFYFLKEVVYNVIAFEHSLENYPQEMQKMIV